MNRIAEVRQHDLKDCGACSISSIIKYYGGYVPLEKIREDTLTGANGTTAYHLIQALNSYGFESLGVKVQNIQDKNIYLPAIAHLVLKNGLQHFVVIYKITTKYVYLMDPARGLTKMPVKDFLEVWDNILILVSPVSTILKLNKETTIVDIFLNLLKENKKLFILILIVNIIFIFLTIVGSFYFQVAISMIESGNDIWLLKFVVILFGVITLFKVSASFIKSYCLTYLNKNLDVVLYSDFLSHIFKLPLKFMQNRTTGEVISRIDELGEIKGFLSEIFTTFILNSILVMASVIVLYLINAQLFFVLCLIISIYLIVGLLFSKVIYQKVKEVIFNSTQFNSNLVENVEMNNSIKNLNLVNEFLRRLEEKLVMMLRGNFKLENFLNKINFLKSFIYDIGLFLVSTYGIYLIYQGKLSILSLITFNSVILYLFDPVKDLIDLLPKYSYLKASFNKISEFLNINEEELDKGLKNINGEMIKFDDVSFSYNKYTNVLNNLNIEILNHEKVLLWGKSGSGKSTICKLLYRIYEGYTGKINFCERSESDYSLQAIRNQILYVGQEESLFTGSIKENIVCFRSIPEEELLEVMKICKIDEIIDKRPARLETKINASLNNLSGGEKQRIILARALLKKSSIIILDEALSEVNISMEREIIDNLFLYLKNKTMIYVSHKDIRDKFEKVITVGVNND